LQLVRNGKDELARIRVENIIREEEMSQAYELIDLFCEKLQTRLDLLESHEHCPDELLECLHTIIYCGGLISEITELSQINGQFARKYGSDYVSDILLNGSPFVNGQVKYKLTIKQPDHHFVEKYLLGIVGPVDSKHIHHHENNNLSGTSHNFEDNEPPSYLQPNGGSNIPPNYMMPPTNPEVSNQPKGDKPNDSQQNTTMDLDDLTTRFEALKKKTHHP